MGSFSLVHWLVLGLVVVLLFGAGRIGEVGKGLGEGIRNFKKGLSSDDDKDEDADEKEAAEAKQLKKGSKASEDESADSKSKNKKA